MKKFLWIIILLIASNLFADKYMLPITILAGYDVLNDNEIVYTKRIVSVAAKMDIYSLPKKNELEICKCDIRDPKAEKVLVHIEFEETYSKEDSDFHTTYKNKFLEGARSITPINACPAIQKIAFVVRTEPGFHSIDGLYTVDYNGKNLERLIPYRVDKFAWNQDGTKILFQTSKYGGLIENTGKDSGIFLYDLKSDQYQFVLDEKRINNYDRYGFSVWTSDETGIIFKGRTDREHPNGVVYRIDIDGTNLQEVPDVQPYLLSASKKYYVYPEGRVFEGIPGEGKEVIFQKTQPFEDVKSWFPDGDRLLARDAERNILIVNVETKEIVVVVKGSPPLLVNMVM